MYFLFFKDLLFLSLSPSYHTYQSTTTTSIRRPIRNDESPTRFIARINSATTNRIPGVGTSRPH